VTRHAYSNWEYCATTSLLSHVSACPYGSFANLADQCKNICHEKIIDSCVNGLCCRYDFCGQQRGWPANSGFFERTTKLRFRRSPPPRGERSKTLCARGEGEAVRDGRFPVGINHAPKTYGCQAWTSRRRKNPGATHAEDTERQSQLCHRHE